MPLQTCRSPCSPPKRCRQNFVRASTDVVVSVMVLFLLDVVVSPLLPSGLFLCLLSVPDLHATRHTCNHYGPKFVSNPRPAVILLGVFGLRTAGMPYERGEFAVLRQKRVFGLEDLFQAPIGQTPHILRVKSIREFFSRLGLGRPHDLVVNFENVER